MSDFGDFDVDDALDTAAADPEQVARKLQALRHEHNPGAATWNDFSTAERATAILVVTLLLGWLRRQGAH